MAKVKPLIMRGTLTTGPYTGWHVLSRTKSNQEVLVRDLGEALAIVKASATEPLNDKR